MIMRTSLQSIIILIFLSAFSVDLNGQGWIRHGIEGKMIPLNEGKIISLGFDKIIKSDENANIIWEIRMGSFLNNEAESYSSISLSDAIELPNGHYLFAGNTGSQAYITEITSLGIKVWEKVLDFGTTLGGDRITSIIPAGDDFIISGSIGIHQTADDQFKSQILLAKINISGDILWRTEFSYNENDGENGGLVIQLSDGTFMLMARYITNTAPFGEIDITITLININEEGEVLNEYFYEDEVYSQLPFIHHFIQTPDNGFFFGEGRACYGCQETKFLKTDAQGQVEWRDTLNNFHFADIALSHQGNILLLGHTASPQVQGRDILFREYDLDGNINWARQIGEGGDDSAKGLALHSDGGYIIAGGDGFMNLLTGWAGDFSPDGDWFKTDSIGRIYSNDISGNVFEDFDVDCEYNGEEGFPQWILALESFSTSTKFAVTDQMGHYGFPIRSGEYNLSINNKGPYWQGCNDPFTAEVIANDTIIANLGQQSNVDCPYLEVDISAAFIRRCFESTYAVTYCNRGTSPAENAYVEVSLDPLFTYISSTNPLISNIDNVLTFDLGDVEMNACGAFYITILVDCDDTILGQTHCTTAHIYPDYFCIESPDWSGASVDVNANCQGDSIQFLITNVGGAPTSEILGYFVVEDQVILLEGNFPETPSGGSQMVTIPSTGSTFRFEIEQEPNHPGSSRPTVTVEGCTSSNDDISLGYVTQYWENDGDSFISIDCQENIGSFDPNDKRAYPKGYGEEHLIEKNEDIEYHIRFQNTGSDTAFTVVIRDPISDKLDMSFIRPGASSHPYEMDIVDGRVLKFTFPNINLLDSLTHESESHGFIKFKIKQKANLHNGERIENEAAIFFDFNDPVITNTTFHTIGSDFIPSIFVPETTDSEEEIAVQIEPNPFSEQTRIELSLEPSQFPVKLLVIDALGRKIKEESYDGNIIQFDAKELQKGVYFLRLQSKYKALGQSKFIIQ